LLEGSNGVELVTRWI